MDAGDGSSYRCETSEAWANLDVEAAVGGVAREAAASTGPKGAASGRTSVLLEPQAVADLLPFLIFSLNARSADEGVTVFSGMEGRRVSGPSLTMRSLLAGSVPGRPFDGEGLPCRDALWIEKGVLREMICDRFWAGKTGRPPLSSPQCYYMDGGEGGVEEGLGLMDRGILIRRLWYIRFVDQRSLEITGMTRDGVFAVEGGRIVEPLKDFRWNWLPLSLFRRIAWLGRPVRKGRLHVPPMVLEDVKTD
jgi:predicted Zn-dependent protease